MAHRIITSGEEGKSQEQYAQLLSLLRIGHILRLGKAKSSMRLQKPRNA